MSVLAYSVEQSCPLVVILGTVKNTANEEDLIQKGTITMISIFTVNHFHCTSKYKYAIIKPLAYNQTVSVQ